MGQYRTLSEVNGDDGRKEHFSYAAAFNAPADGVNLEFGNAGCG